jgi:hypothetical protein
MRKTNLPNTDALRTFQLVITEEDARPIWETMGEAIIRQTTEDAAAFENNQAANIGPDTLILSGHHVMLADGGRIGLPKDGWPVRTTFFCAPDGIGFAIGEVAETLTMSPDIKGREVFLDTIQKRNDAAGFSMPEALKALFEKADEITSYPEARKADSFSLHTGQEWTALINCASDGKTSRNIIPNEQNGSLRHKRPGAPFFTEFVLLDEEREAGHGVELLQQATQELDVDDGIAWLYISDLLAPPGPLPPYAAATAWIDLDDVARKTMGGYARDTAELMKRRAKVYHAIRCGARAYIGGERSIAYQEKQTGKQIDTRIYTTPWQIVSRQDAQASLWPCDSIPLRVELVASREWTSLTTNPDTAQYLSLGEVIGAIPANQASGAWARALALAYVNWCRWHLHAALRGEAPTRRQLLDQHPAKKAPYLSFLKKNPARVTEYWHGAEHYLHEQGLISAIQKSPDKWDKNWLAQSPNWNPGTRLRPMLEALTKSRFEPKPRELNPAKRKIKKTAKRTSSV